MISRPRRQQKKRDAMRYEMDWSWKSLTSLHTCTCSYQGCLLHWLTDCQAGMEDFFQPPEDFPKLFPLICLQIWRQQLTDWPKTGQDRTELDRTDYPVKLRLAWVGQLLFGISLVLLSLSHIKRTNLLVRTDGRTDGRSLLLYISLCRSSSFAVYQGTGQNIMRSVGRPAFNHIFKEELLEIANVVPLFSSRTMMSLPSKVHLPSRSSRPHTKERRRTLL